MLKRLFSVCCAIVLTGCAAYLPVPKDYAGPVATVYDTAIPEDGTKAQLFALTEVDGNRIMNAFWASTSASQGQGPRLTVVLQDRKVPVRTMKVELKASHATGAPIHAIASQIAGTFFSVEGVVEFSPKANGRYAVKGDLKKEKSSVWIEDLETGRPATEVISK